MGAIGGVRSDLVEPGPGKGEPDTQRTCPDILWPEDPPLSERQTGRAFSLPFSIVRGTKPLNTLGPILLLPTFLSPHILSCPPHNPPFFLW